MISTDLWIFWFSLLFLFIVIRKYTIISKFFKNILKLILWPAIMLYLGEIFHVHVNIIYSAAVECSVLLMSVKSSCSVVLFTSSVLHWSSVPLVKMGQWVFYISVAISFFLQFCNCFKCLRALGFDAYMFIVVLSSWLVVFLSLSFFVVIVLDLSVFSLIVVYMLF